MPASSESVSPSLWPLSDEGRRAAEALSVPAGALLVASAEAKARQTLEPFGPVLLDSRFNEVRRTDEPWEGEYLALRRAYVGGVDHANWEPRSEVVARFAAGIRDHTAAAGDRPLVVATHGM